MQTPRKRVNRDAERKNEEASESSKRKVFRVDYQPSPSFVLFNLFLMFIRRHRLFVACVCSWILFKLLQKLLLSSIFQRKVLLLEFTRTWPPCDLEQPRRPQKLPFMLRWVDWIPERFGLEDLKSFPGMSNVRNIEVWKRRRIPTWLLEPTQAQGEEPQERKGVVLYVKGRSSHRGMRSRLKLYERITQEPVRMHCVTFDSPIDETDEDVSSERSFLVSAHAVWSTITRPPYSFPSDSVVIWGSSFGCCSAANLCLYLMRRGTPPAALVLENPAISFPKLLASRFEFLGAITQRRIETLAKTMLVHRFDLEKRVRSICSSNSSVPILLISAEYDWSVPPAHAQRLADVASAMTASRKVRLLSLPVFRSEVSNHGHFAPEVATFINQSLADMRLSRFSRRLSVGDYGGSPRTFATDQLSEDRIYEEEESRSFDPPFGL